MNDNSQSIPSARQNLIGGALSVAFGIFVLVIASSYPMGSPLRMGPGFFPCVVAVLIVLLGLTLMLNGLRSHPTVSSTPVQWRSILAISLGVLLFAVSLERLGLVPATLMLVLVSSLAAPRWRPWRAAVLAVAVTALVYLVFVIVLQIPVAAVRL
jgi:hypothetical protein